MTALMVASKEGHAAVVRVLLAAGANTTLKNAVRTHSCHHDSSAVSRRLVESSRAVTLHVDVVGFACTHSSRCVCRVVWRRAAFPRTVRRRSCSRCLQVACPSWSGSWSTVASWQTRRTTYVRGGRQLPRCCRGGDGHGAVVRSHASTARLHATHDRGEERQLRPGGDDALIGQSMQGTQQRERRVFVGLSLHSFHPSIPRHCTPSVPPFPLHSTHSLCLRVVVAQRVTCASHGG
jgi:hypothetical protein